MKDLIAGSWNSLSFYRSFYWIPRIIFPTFYMHSTLVLALACTWSNKNFPCQHSVLQVYLADSSKFTVQTICPNSLLLTFMWGFFQVFATIHLRISHYIIPSTENPLPYNSCKYLKIKVKLWDMHTDRILFIFTIWFDMLNFLTCVFQITRDVHSVFLQIISYLEQSPWILIVYSFLIFYDA